MILYIGLNSQQKTETIHIIYISHFMIKYLGNIIIELI